MTTKLTVHDYAGARLLRSFNIEGLNERCSLREIIRSRVYQEVQDHNQGLHEFYQGIVAPSDSEPTASGFKVKKGRQIDWEDQYARALDGFGQNRFFVLIGTAQATSLDQTFDVTPETEITFLKLVQLVGG
jgi:hypothetical protein